MPSIFNIEKKKVISNEIFYANTDSNVKDN